MTDKELAKPAPAPQATTPDPEQILALAMEKNVTGDELEKYLAAYERMHDRKAAIAFNKAMAGFQASCPLIPRTSTAKISTKKGSQYSYQYAELSTIAGIVNPVLHEHGLSYTWDSTVVPSSVTTTCTVRHSDGHSVPSSTTIPTDTDAGMSPQQKVASAMTFARRQTLVQALGLTMCDPDFDGAAAPEPFQPLDDKQLRQLEDLYSQADPDKTRFWRFASGLAGKTIEKLSEIPAGHYKAVADELERKIDRNKREGP